MDLYTAISEALEDCTRDYDILLCWILVRLVLIIVNLHYND